MKFLSVRATAPPFLAALVFVASPALARQWTNDEGESIEADLVRIKGRTAILRTNGSNEIPAPIARLSEADQAWIEHYKELTTTRVWGVAGEGVRRGQFINVTQEAVRLKQGTSTTDVPFEELSPEGWMRVYQAYQLYEKPPATAFMAAKPESLRPKDNGVDPLTAPLREWTSTDGRAIRAAYLGTDGAAALLFRHAKEVAVPLSRLSEADRRWVAEQKLAGFRLGLQQATAGFAQAAARAASNPSLRQQLAPPTPVEPPTVVSTAAVETAAPVEPVASPAQVVAGPTLRHINRLSDAEQRQRLQDAFGDLAVLEESYVGAATCDHCRGYFIFPNGYGIGDPCPYCTAKIDEVASLTAYRTGASAGGGAAGSGSWLSSGLGRVVIGVAVVGVLAVVTKLAMSGGGEEDDADKEGDE